VFVATLFDYNGVLVDDEHIHLEAFRDALGPLAVDVSEQTYFDRYIGFDDAGAFRAILFDAGRDAPEELIRDLIAQKRPHYMQRALTGLRLFSGASDLVRRAAARGPVGVVSGALRDEIELGLERLGVRELVEFVVSAEDVPRSKPEPDCYLRGLSELSRVLDRPVAARVLVIEDSPAGVRAAKTAGLACLALTHSAPRPALEEAGADHVSDDIGEVDALVLETLYRKLHGP
jgi:HAD superfamily hydrolase (TIGR01509 family)